MVDRLDYKIVGVAIVVLLCCVGYTPLEGRSALVWSDDFNDGNYDGWTICSPSWGNAPSSWSAANYYLQIEQENYGSISHPSTLAYGNWSFDFKANEAQVRVGVGVDIAFVSNDVNNATETPTADDWSCYGFKAHGAAGGTGYRLYLLKWHDGHRTDIGYNSTVLPVAGWHHIEVTRSTTGHFRLYHNGSLVMQGVDTELTASKLFVVSLVDRHMIDNIEVYEYTDDVGPSISAVARDPTNPTSDDDVTVSATVEDNSGVSSATLQYRIGAEAWQNVTMTAADSTYSADIPAQADGTTVYYRIVATDSVGNEAVSSESSYTVGTTTIATTTTTTTTPSPIPMELMLVAGVGAAVIVVAIVCLRRK